MRILRIMLFICLLLNWAYMGPFAVFADLHSAYAQEKPVQQEPHPFKSYSDVITDSSITQEGVFIIHRENGKLYFEIPSAQLEREFLWVTQFSATQTSYSYGGMPIIDRVVRWQRRGNRILLRNVEYEKRADPGTPEAQAVKASTVEAIIKAFDILTVNDQNGSVVIDVTELFVGDTPEFSPRNDLQFAQSKGDLQHVDSIDKRRTFITSVKSFPQNIEARVLATFARKPLITSDQRQKEPSRSDISLGSVTVEIHHSMVALPDDPMQPRFYDWRVGIFRTAFENYSSEREEVEIVSFIKRWRLEKKDPEAAMSEPVKPILFYVGRGVPKRWRKYVSEGIEMWQSAFEKAGFLNAIIARDAPNIDGDPDWDAEDARYSVIRWLPSTIRDGFGPTITDPRTGEILEADVRLYHNVVQLERDWYFIMCSATDPRARTLPLPEDIMGALIRSVTAHEVGHSLGLRHNRKSSQHYSVEQVRDPEFTRRYGYKASLMDYSRYNYVAQPGDDAVLRMDKPGIYDEFAIEWAYRPVPGADTPEDEKPVLDEIANRQLQDPRLLWGAGNEDGAEGRADPFARGYDLTNEPMAASALGLQNLRRIMSYLVESTGKQGEDYQLLQHMYGELGTHREHLLSNVAVLVGGIEFNKKSYGQPRDVFVPIAPEVQRAAIAFLNENAFVIPDWLQPADIIERIGIAGVSSTTLAVQNSMLDILFDATRIGRMIDLEATRENAFTVDELVSLLTGGIFSELKTEAKDIGVYRRNLQRAYIDRMIRILSDDHFSSTDLRAVARGALRSVEKAIDDADIAESSRITRLHLSDLSNRIDHALKGMNSAEK